MSAVANTQRASVERIHLGASPRVPWELCDRIIDCIADHYYYVFVNRWLYACALTCRSWFPRSTYHLYRRIHLFDDYGSSTFIRTLRMHPHLAASMHTLYISLKRVRSFRGWHSLPMRMTSSQMKGLQCLLLEGPEGSPEDLVLGDIGANIHRAWFMSIRHFSTIVTLDLHRVRFTTFGDLIRVTTSFPLLQTLYIYEVRVKAEFRGPIPTTKKLSSRLANCYFIRIMQCINGHYNRTVPFFPFLAWMAQTDGAHAVEHFTFDLERYIHPWAEELHHAMEQFLQTSGSRLRKLDVVLDDVHWLHLGANSSLRSLSLSEISVLGALRVVDSITSPVLEEIRLSITQPMVETNLASIEPALETLDISLSSRQLPVLSQCILYLEFPKQFSWSRSGAQEQTKDLSMPSRLLRNAHLSRDRWWHQEVPEGIEADSNRFRDDRPRSQQVSDILEVTRRLHRSYTLLGSRLIIEVRRRPSPVLNTLYASQGKRELIR